MKRFQKQRFVRHGSPVARSGVCDDGTGARGGKKPPATANWGLTCEAAAVGTIAAEPPSRRAAEPPSRRAAEPPSRRS